MTSPASSPPPDDATVASADAVVAQFLAAWSEAPQPDVARFLPESGAADRRALLEKLIAADLELRAEHGDPPRLESYLDRFPELGPPDQISPHLVAAEYAARAASGQSIDLAEYKVRFPNQYAQLQSHLHTVGTSDDQVQLPDPDRPLTPGDRILEFEIIASLGAGSHAQVFLARDHRLDRHVALKVSRDVGDEGRALANLDHPHIIPVYSQHVIDHRKLLAMRFVPGRTLAERFAYLAEQQEARRPHLDLASWLAASVADPRDQSTSADRPTTSTTEKENPTRTNCRLILELASALSHAHLRGVLHRDIKPANILLDSKARALLMDFSVAARTHRDDDLSIFGGTLAYMAPEHLAAVGHQPDAHPDDVDHRSDLYSLGIVFYELLTGRNPSRHAITGQPTESSIHQLLAERVQAPPEIPSGTPGLTPGLASIVGKLLQPRPDDRYQSADQLVADLSAFLDHRPLLHADDPSHRERLTKWRRRHPALIAAAVAALLVAASLTAWTAYTDLQRIHTAETHLDRAAQRIDLVADSTNTIDNLESLDLSASDLERARQLLAAESAWTTRLISPDRAHHARDRLDEIATAAANIRLDHIRRLVERHKAAQASGATAHIAADATGALEHLGVIDDDAWQSKSPWIDLSDDDRLRLARDVTELLVVRADSALQKRAAASEATDPSAPDVTEFTAIARLLLDRVPRVHRDSPVIAALQNCVAEPSCTSAALTPPTETDLRPFDHYLYAVLHARRHDYAAAAQALDRAFAASPDAPDVWMHFLYAYVLQQQDRPDEAIVHYSACTGLRPDFAWPHHNLGLVYAAQQKYDLALAAFTRAINLDPTLHVARAERAAVHLYRDEPRPALVDLTAAIDAGYHTPEAFSNRAAAHAALGDRSAAIDDLQRALRIDPGFTDAQENLRRLRAAL